MEKIKTQLEKHNDDDRKVASAIDGLPLRFYEHFVMAGLRVDLIEPGRIVCTLKVPARLLVCFSSSSSSSSTSTCFFC